METNGTEIWRGKGNRRHTRGFISSKSSNERN